MWPNNPQEPLRWPRIALHRWFAAALCGLIAWGIGEALGAPTWSETAIVADNITFFILTFLAVLFLTHKETTNVESDSGSDGPSGFERL